MTDKIIVYSTVWCPDCKRVKKFLGEHGIQYDDIDIDRHPEAVDIVKQLNHGMRSVPTIVFPDGSILVEPSTSQLAEKLGIAVGSN
jgi:mycoredoxin